MVDDAYTLESKKEKMQHWQKESREISSEAMFSLVLSFFLSLTKFWDEVEDLRFI